LTDTHSTIPALLVARVEAASNVGAAEVFGDRDRSAARSHFDEVEAELTAAGQQRRGAVAALIAQEQELSSALARLEEAKTSYASGILADFNRRYQHALEAFLQVWAEGDMLSRSLRTPVSMQPPIQVSNLGREGFRVEKSTEVVRALPESPIGAKIDPVAEKIGRQLDELTAAITYCKGLADTQSRHRPNLDSNWPFDPAGVFVVRQPFNDPDRPAALSRWVFDRPHLA
jgi:multidrug efflux pump subunit AcrA (membrane-fusion protein)